MMVVTLNQLHVHGPSANHRRSRSHSQGPTVTAATAPTTTQAPMTAMALRRRRNHRMAKDPVAIGDSTGEFRLAITSVPRTSVITATAANVPACIPVSRIPEDADALAVPFGAFS